MHKEILAELYSSGFTSESSSLSMQKTPSTYIHLGAPKTATTCLQSQLFARHSQIHYFGKFISAGKSNECSVLRNMSLGHTEKNSEIVLKAKIEEQLAYAEKKDLAPILSKESLAG